MASTPLLISVTNEDVENGTIVRDEGPYNPVTVDLTTIDIPENIEISKTITANGTYQINPTTENYPDYDGFSNISLTVRVPTGNVLYADRFMPVTSFVPSILFSNMIYTSDGTTVSLNVLTKPVCVYMIPNSEVTTMGDYDVYFIQVNANRTVTIPSNAYYGTTTAAMGGRIGVANGTDMLFASRQSESSTDANFTWVFTMDKYIINPGSFPEFGI